MSDDIRVIKEPQFPIKLIGLPSNILPDKIQLVNVMSREEALLTFFKPMS